MCDYVILCRFPLINHPKSTFSLMNEQYYNFFMAIVIIPVFYDLTM